MISSIPPLPAFQQGCTFSVEAFRPKLKRPPTSESKPPMLTILRDRTYRHLFFAQVVALLGTGLATVALALLAYDLAPDRAGLVLGTVFTIKMVAYVGIAPVAGAFVQHLPRRAMLVSLDAVRAAVALCLPFVSAIWQVYALVFVLQAASAAFTPTFQATIPDVLPEEDRYTRALSLSRLAYDLETLVSPTLAALLLALVGYQALFLGTAAGFLASALLVVSVLLPRKKFMRRRGVYERTTRGIRIYLATPRLRGLLALNLAAAAAGAMVLVNTIVLARTGLGLGGHRGRPGTRRVRRGLDAGRARPAANARWRRGPPGDALRRCPSRGRSRGAGGPCRPDATALRHLARNVGHRRHRILGRSDAVGPPPRALRSCRRPPGRLCGAVRAFPCMLAADLSAGGMARHRFRHDSRIARPCRPPPDRPAPRPPTLAERSAGRTCAPARRPAARPSTSGRPDTSPPSGHYR